MTDKIKRFVPFLLTLALCFGCLSLAACGGSGSEDQDNCYGEDMPVINKD